MSNNPPSFLLYNNFLKRAAACRWGRRSIKREITSGGVKNQYICLVCESNDTTIRDKVRL